MGGFINKNLQTHFPWLTTTWKSFEPYPSNISSGQTPYQEGSFWDHREFRILFLQFRFQQRINTLMGSEKYFCSAAGEIFVPGSKNTSLSLLKSVPFHYCSIFAVRTAFYCILSASDLRKVCCIIFCCRIFIEKKFAVEFCIILQQIAVEKKLWFRSSKIYLEVRVR